MAGARRDGSSIAVSPCVTKENPLHFALQVQQVMEYWCTSSSGGTAFPWTPMRNPDGKRAEPVFTTPDQEDHDLYEFMALESTIKNDTEEVEEMDEAGCPWVLR